MFFARFLAFSFVVTAFASFAHAEDSNGERPFLSRFGATVGADYDYGTLQNSGLNQPSRSVDAISLEGLVGYRIGPVFIGPDFDYRFEGQLSSLDQSGGTNLKGHGWLLGLGANYQFSPRWSLQGAIDFAGKYTFYKQTDASEDDNLSQPLILRAKAQYFSFPKISLSFDFDVQYVSYSRWHITSVDYSSSTNGFFVGVGLTWHFGSSERVADSDRSGVASKDDRRDYDLSPKVTNETITASTHTVTPQQIGELKADLEKIVDVKQTDNGLLVNIKGDMSFASGSSELTPESKANLAKTAEILNRAPGTKIRIIGHTDSSGIKRKNQVLSVARATSVKEIFLANGFSADRVTASGVGDAKPLVSNESAKGRATNRRVEIHIEH